jgi:hypothetical protein
MQAKSLSFKARLDGLRQFYEMYKKQADVIKWMHVHAKATVF